MYGIVGWIMSEKTNISKNKFIERIEGNVLFAKNIRKKDKGRKCTKRNIGKNLLNKKNES